MDAKDLILEDFRVLAVLKGTMDDDAVGVEVLASTAYIITVKLHKKGEDTLKEAHKMLDEAFYSTHRRSLK